MKPLKQIIAEVAMVRIDEIGDTERGKKRLAKYLHKATDQVAFDQKIGYEDDKWFNRDLGIHGAIDRIALGSKKGIKPGQKRRKVANS